jgi:hypothetical protein
MPISKEKISNTRYIAESYAFKCTVLMATVIDASSGRIIQYAEGVETRETVGNPTMSLAVKRRNPCIT